MIPDFNHAFRDAVFQNFRGDYKVGTPNSSIAGRSASIVPTWRVSRFIGGDQCWCAHSHVCAPVGRIEH